MTTKRMNPKSCRDNGDTEKADRFAKQLVRMIVERVGFDAEKFPERDAIIPEFYCLVKNRLKRCDLKEAESSHESKNAGDLGDGFANDLSRVLFLTISTYVGDERCDLPFFERLKSTVQSTLKTLNSES